MLLDPAPCGHSGFLVHHNGRGGAQNAAGVADRGPSHLLSPNWCLDCPLLLLDTQSAPESACPPDARVQADRDDHSRADHTQVEGYSVRSRLVLTAHHCSNHDARRDILHIARE